MDIDTSDREEKTFLVIAAVAFFLTSQQMLQTMNIVAILFLIINKQKRYVIIYRLYFIYNVINVIIISR